MPCWIWTPSSSMTRAAGLQYSEHIEGNGAEMFAKACSMGLEGIVSKQAAPYLPGRERSWLKSKYAQRQEFIIIGYRFSRVSKEGENWNSTFSCSEEHWKASDLRLVTSFETLKFP